VRLASLALGLAIGLGAVGRARGLAPGVIGRDTIAVHGVAAPPTPDRLADTSGWGPPQATLGSTPMPAAVWLLRLADSVYVVALVSDSTTSWADELVTSLDTDGDRAGAPQHDDFQWCFRRRLDTSVVYRGRAGRWAAPQDDPDWRLGRARSGDGWDVRAGETARGWLVVLRLDAGWLEQAGARGAGLSVRYYDEGERTWSVWPRAPHGATPLTVERTPALWAVVRS